MATIHFAAARRMEQQTVPKTQTPYTIVHGCVMCAHVSATVYFKIIPFIRSCPIVRACNSRSKNEAITTHVCRPSCQGQQGKS